MFGKNGTHFSGSCAQPKSRPGPLACEASHRIKEAGYRRKQERPLDRCQSGVQALDIPGKFMSAAWRRLRLRSNAATARASQKRRGLPPPRQRSHRPKSAAARNSNRARRARLSQIYLTKFSVRFSDGKRLGKTEADVKSVRKKFLTFIIARPGGAGRAALGKLQGLRGARSPGGSLRPVPASPAKPIHPAHGRDASAPLMPGENPCL